MDSEQLPALIANKLNALLENEDHPMSQSELARASGIAQPTISRILKGDNNTSVETLLDITEALGVTLNDVAYAETGPVKGTPRDRPARTRPRSESASTPSQYTALQQSVIDAFTKLVKSRQISDLECIELLSQWVARLE